MLYMFQCEPLPPPLSCVKTMTMLRLVVLVVGLACLCAGEQEALRGGATLDGSADGSADSSAGSGSDAGSGSEGQEEATTVAAAGSESEAAAESAGSESEAHATGKSGSEGEEVHHHGSSGSSGSAAPRPQFVPQQTPVVAEKSKDVKAEEDSLKRLRASLITVRKSNAEERAGKVRSVAALSSNTSSASMLSVIDRTRCVCSSLAYAQWRGRGREALTGTAKQPS